MKTIKLGEYGSFRNGLNFSKEESKGQGCKILGVGDFENKTYIPIDSLGEINADLVTDDDTIQDGDIIFVRSNGNKSLVGRMLLAKGIKERICYSGFCIRFRPHNRDNALKLFYSLKSPYCKRQYTPSQQTNITNLSQDKLSEVLIPDFLITPVQNKAENLLSNLDEMIDLNKRLCAEMEAMAKTLYDYWFVQFDFPDENGKPYRTSGGAMEWCPALKKEVPKGWKATNVAQITESITDGVHESVENDPKGEFLLLSCKNIMEGYVHFDKSDRTISKASFEKIRSRTKLEEGDILISSVGSVGEVCLLTEQPVCFDFQRSVAMLKPDKDSISSYWLYEMFISIKPLLRLLAHGAVQQCLFISDICGIDTVLPNKPIIDLYSQTVSPMFKSIKRLHDENRELIHLRDWLLPMLMNGQARVN